MSRGEILEAKVAYDQVRSELMALIVSNSPSHTVLTPLPEIHADGPDAVLLEAFGVATDPQ
jgi:hypothetical protein